MISHEERLSGTNLWQGAQVTGRDRNPFLHVHDRKLIQIKRLLGKKVGLSVVLVIWCPVSFFVGVQIQGTVRQWSNHLIVKVVVVTSVSFLEIDGAQSFTIMRSVSSDLSPPSLEIGLEV